jgi:two-component system, NarL family, response regulator DesR
VPRVLLADDDPSFRSRLEALLALHVPDAELVASVGDGHGAVAAALAHSPDVVVIDYAMPGPHGGHAAAVIQQALPATRIVVVSGLDSDELVDLPADVRVVRKGATLEDELVAALAAQS